MRSPDPSSEACFPCPAEIAKGQEACAWCQATGSCLSAGGAGPWCPAVERPIRLLWVDDDEALARSLTRGFVRFEKAVEARLSTRSQDALELARAYQPDLVALDLDMPVFDGLEVCRQLKGCAETRAARVVLVTGRVRGGLCEEAAAAGAERLLHKPLPILSVLRSFGTPLASPAPRAPWME